MMERRVSEESVMSVLRAFKNQGPEDAVAIDFMVRKAERAIDIYAKDVLLHKEIGVATLLHSLIDLAIDDRGKHYVAYAILAYEREEDPAAFMIQLAETWLTHLLCPGKYISLHGNDSCL
jgi:hypothetical protein